VGTQKVIEVIMPIVALVTFAFQNAAEEIKSFITCTSKVKIELRKIWTS
jgi:hypothetical protein